MPLGKYFVLISDHCRLVLGIEGNSDNEQSLAVLCNNDNGESHQVWFEDLATGTIRSKANDLCLTVSEGENRIRLKAYEPGDSNQKWMVDGKVVRHRENQDKVLDIVDGRGDCGAVLCSWDFHSGTNQQWGVHYLEPRLFYIVSEFNQKVVDIANGDPNPGAKLIVWDKHDNPNQAKNQLWYEDQTGFLRSALNDFAPDGSTKEITMQLFDVNDPDRCWAIYGSTVFLKHRQDQVFDILEGRSEAGASVGVFKIHNGPNQKWYQEYIND